MLLTLALAALCGSSSALAADCTRETLQAGADSLVAAQVVGNPSLLKAADGLTYTENFKAGTLKTGILATALKIDHSRSSLDTTQCATYTELISASGTKPYVLGFQMHFSASGGIAKVDALTTAKGDWLFNATGTLNWAKKEDWGEIAAGKRDSRAVIQAAADAYCDIFANKSVVVPWGKPCARLEGGSYTGNGGPNDSCNVGIPSGVALVDRRYVIDETVGAVDVFLSFSGIPDSHEFRVEGGKLRFVHTLTVMTARSGKSKV
ncbi:hypothetical protein B0T26DRAFT_639347 [Lasiosphaeria miniovina]|uniref:DUF8021 domain-containing protein n=1 Tax=Lasiosphaeria miniovina TaxID=1954250 RepID=A0AA40B6V4_9PEZI|nr:uncharacterized protein B0T26DRAFT_639347 [Lasiosphaeria miniovina]KAK0728776.1 hypothetical protein B0T26DRAFT_639347 [Lasiosphaeria miniovina]